MSDMDHPRGPLVPFIQRADQADTEEPLVVPPVRAGMSHDDWFVLAAGDERPGQHGRWLASDCVVDLDERV